MNLVEILGLESALVPKDITGAAQTGTYISLKNYTGVTILITQGAWAGGTPAVTIDQATAVAGTGAKALTIKAYYQKAAVTASTWAKTVVNGATFNLPATASTVTAIDIDASELDASNDFDCLQVKVASPGANADLLSIQYLLRGPKAPQALLNDAKVD
jgi:hypothetical protein